MTEGLHTQPFWIPRSFVPTWNWKTTTLCNFFSFHSDDKISNLQKIKGENLSATLCTVSSTYQYLHETKADMDKELLERLANFIRGLYMVSAVPSNEPLWDEALAASILPTGSSCLALTYLGQLLGFSIAPILFHNLWGLINTEWSTYMKNGSGKTTEESTSKRGPPFLQEIPLSKLF